MKRKLYKVVHTTDQHVRTQLVVETKKKNAKKVSIASNGNGKVTVEKIPFKKGVIKAFEPEVKIVEN